MRFNVMLKCFLWSGVNFNNKFLCDHRGKLQQQRRQQQLTCNFPEFTAAWKFCNLVATKRMANKVAKREPFKEVGTPCVSRHKLKANEATITSTNTHKGGSNLQLNYDEMGNRMGINCPRNAIMLCPLRSPYYFFSSIPYSLQTEWANKWANEWGLKLGHRSSSTLLPPPGRLMELHIKNLSKW